MPEYGAIFTTDNIKRQLVNMNRDYTGRKSWEKLYGDVGLSTTRQLNAISEDYSQAMSDAYAAAYTNKLSAASSNLGEGYKTAIENELDTALENAYDSYRANYLEAVADIESNAAAAESTIDEVLTKQADYTKKMSDKPYEYLQYLFNKYGEGDEKDNIFYTEPLWQRYTNEEFDEDGNVVGRTLKSWDEIVGFGTKDDETGEWLGLRDADGNLTLKGVDFYDQMLNYYDSTKPGAGSGFGSWLAENDSELFDWSQEYNPYNYTDAGTNVGSFKQLFGLESTDRQYTFFERFGGFTKKDVDNLFADFETKANELSLDLADSKGKAKDTDAMIADYENLTNELKRVADSLGITESLETDMGMTFDQIAEKLATADLAAFDKNEMFGDALGSGLAAGISAGGAVYSVASVGTTIGALLSGAGASASVPVAGWIAAAILAVTAGTVATVSSVKQNRQDNLRAANESKQAYENLLTGLIAYSQYKRNEIQRKSYTK